MTLTVAGAGLQRSPWACIMPRAGFPSSTLGAWLPAPPIPQTPPLLLAFFLSCWFLPLHTFLLLSIFLLTTISGSSASASLTWLTELGVDDVVSAAEDSDDDEGVKKVVGVPPDRVFPPYDGVLLFVGVSAFSVDEEIDTKNSGDTERNIEAAASKYLRA